MVWPFQLGCLPYVQWLHNCCFIFYFVVVCFSSTTFGLHFFCGGGYCGCVSLNIFSASFSWFCFALRRCNFCFWDRVNPDRHHRSMEYLGSTILMAAASYFLFCVGRFAKNHWPFIIFLYDDICCTYFDDVLFCRSFGCCRYVPPLLDWSAFAAEWSNNLAGLVPGDRIEWRSIGLVLEVPTC
jgi:hypothetical protein